MTPFASPLERRIAEFVHNSIPWQLQEFFSPAALLLSPIYLKKGGLHLYRRYYKLRKSQWWTRERIEEYQLERLRKIIGYSYENVPYYTKLFNRESIRPSDIRCFEDMETIPVLKKDDVRRNFHALMSRKRRPGDIAAVSKTSGTTGKPFTIYHNRESYVLLQAIYELAHDVAGLHNVIKRALLFSRRVCFYGMGTKSRGFFFGRNPDYDPLIRQIIFMNVADERIFLEYYRIIKRLKPRFMLARPQTLYLFTSFLKRRGLYDIHFDSILCAGEMLLKNHRDAIERHFGCRIFNLYASNENIIRAFECGRHEGQHIHPELSFTETIRNNKQVFNRPGKITCTTLHNYCMPLIRYEIGDLGTISRRRCGCGRQSLMLESIDGRTNDIIRLPNGNYVFPIAFIELMSEMKNIRESQVVQESEGELVIRVVRDHGHTERDTRSLVSSVKSLTGPGVKIRVSFEDMIYEEGKKYKFIVSRIPVEF